MEKWLSKRLRFDEILNKADRKNTFTYWENQFLEIFYILLSLVQILYSFYVHSLTLYILSVRLERTVK
jgi:hypothetical protein